MESTIFSLAELNSAQKAAVSHIEGPLMIIAGAGSGKTKVLTYRIAYLIEQGVLPAQILALTFTNKAAKEMRERIAHLIGAGANAIAMGTFHSVFSKILRKNAHYLGYASNFTIYDSQDSKNVLKSVLEAMGLDEKIYKINTIYGRISQCKNQLISTAEYLHRNDLIEEDKKAQRPAFAQIYAQYQQKCFRSSAMDFDDLLFQMHLLLEKFPEILAHYQDFFQFILVDEYQDTNAAQYHIIQKLAAKHRNICVVGDDAQSIYGFRGADIENIFSFRKDYPQHQLYKLEQNYRSSSNIVQAANTVIAKNSNQIPKTIFTQNPAGDKIPVVPAANDLEEATFIAQNILENKLLHRFENQDFAILYRTNAQSRALEEALRKKNIPYKIYGGLSFYQRKEIKDLVAYFRLIINFQDEESLKRIINYPKRGIGDTSLDKAILLGNELNLPLWEILEKPSLYPLKWTSGTLHKVEEFITMIKNFHYDLEKMKAYDLAVKIAKETTFLKELFADKTPEGAARYENVQELLNAIQEFSMDATEEKPKTLSDFLVEIALLTEAEEEKVEDKNRVSLMSIHNSKGLEFEIVYLCGLEENLFPSQMALFSKTELEEERRLFYVALTRAKQKLYLSYARQRFRWGQTVFSEASRFIEEIDPEFLDQNTIAPASTQNNILPRGQKFVRQWSSLSSPTSKKMPATSQENFEDLQVGKTVAHERFGKGKILQRENDKVLVYFPAVGNKLLMIKFAKLQILEE